MTPIIRNITGKGITIPPTVLNLSDFAPTDQLALHVLDNTLVLAKRKMTAYDILRTVTQLSRLSNSLLIQYLSLSTIRICFIQDIQDSLITVCFIIYFL